MKKILCALCFSLLAVSAAPAALVTLTLPAAGSHTDASMFTTSSSLSGATFDIQYTLNAFATDISVAPYIQSNGTIFGVGSVPDGVNVNQQLSVDGGDGEQLSITNLSITNFVAGGSGLSVGDLSISFDALAFTNGSANPDGVAISFSGFGVSEDSVTSPAEPPALVDLKTLTNFNAASADLYLQPDNAAGNNRWSVAGIDVSVTVVAVPEPSSLCMLGLGSISLLTRRRKRS